MIETFKKSTTRWLSNMTLVRIFYKGHWYASVEHAYMSEKSEEQSWKDICRSEMYSPYEIKAKTRDPLILQLRPDWDEIKLQVMEDCLRLKFTQEPFKSLLLATGDQNIQEGNTWGDDYWGVDLNKNPNVGENHLGRLIMKIRDELRNEVQTFKVIIAGGRKFNDYNLVKTYCDKVLSNRSNIVIVSGKADGADTLGENYAKERGYEIDPYPAPWNDIEGKPDYEIGVRWDGKKYWKKAGTYRNGLMADNANALIAFWDGKSTGTANMIKQAKEKGLLVKVKQY